MAVPIDGLRACAPAVRTFSYSHGMSADPDDVCRDLGQDPSGVAARLARATLANLDAVTARLVEDILQENPNYHDSAQVSKEDLWMSCRDNVERVLQLLGACVPAGVDPFDAARRTGRRRAEQRAALDLVLRSFRLGGRVVWSSTLETARENGDVESSTVLDVATSMWTVVDAVSSSMSDAYRDAELEALRADEQRKHVLVENLLAGAGEDPTYAEEALHTLGLPTASDGCAVVVEQGEWGPVEQTRSREVLTQHGIRSAWLVQSATAIGIVALGERSVASLAEWLSGKAHARIGISPAVASCSAFPQAREWALAALRAVPLGTVGAVSLDGRLPHAMVARCPDLAERLIATTLGPILALPADERDVLLDTVDTWLRADRSAKRTAAQLYCHRNTVLNRLGRLESLLGRTVGGVEDAVWLSLALYARTLRTS